jgi:hypothetical protein
VNLFEKPTHEKAKYCKNLQEKYTTFLSQTNHARAETLWEHGHFRHPCIFAPVGGLLYSILYLVPPTVCTAIKNYLLFVRKAVYS